MYPAQQGDHVVFVEDVLSRAARLGAVDVLIVAGLPTAMTLRSEIVYDDGPTVGAQTVGGLVRELLAHKVGRAWSYDPELLRDVSFVAVLPTGRRVRATVFRQRGTLAVVLRPVAPGVPSLDALGIPSALAGLLRRRRGLILVAGPSASGKSTTLAAMVDHINRHSARHIISIESPVEHVHQPARSVISQRSIPDDVPSYARAVRAALRQAPDVLVIGDIHDRDTAEAALQAAESGHLVIGAVHSKDAADAVDRIQAYFPAGQRRQVGTQIANALVAVLVQQLLGRRDRTGRALATEFLLATAAVRHVIRAGETYRLNTFIQSGRQLGMHTMEDSLVQLALSGVIDYGEAVTATPDIGLFMNLYRKRLQETRRGIGRYVTGGRDVLVTPPAGAYGLGVPPEGSTYRTLLDERALDLWQSNGLLSFEQGALCYRPDPFQAALYAQLTDYGIWLGARPPFRLNNFARLILRARPDPSDEGGEWGAGEPASPASAAGAGIGPAAPRTRVWVLAVLDGGVVATLPPEGEPGAELPLDGLWQTLYLPVAPSLAGRTVRAFAIRFGRARIEAEIREVLFV